MADKNWNDSSFATGDRLLAAEWVNHILHGHAINVSGGNISLGGGIIYTTNLLLKEEDSGGFVFRNSSDTTDADLYLDAVKANTVTERNNDSGVYVENVHFKDGNIILDSGEYLTVNSAGPTDWSIKHTVTPINAILNTAYATVFRCFDGSGNQGFYFQGSSNAHLFEIGNNGNAVLSGTLKLDAVEEKNNGSGVTVESVKFKDAFATFTPIGPNVPDNLSLFLNSSTNKLSYKDLNGSVQDLY